MKLWDLENEELIKTFEGHSAEVNTVCFSPNGCNLLSGAEDDTIKLWDRESGKLLKTLLGHYSSVISVCFSPDGNSILSGSRDGTIKLWELPYIKLSGKKTTTSNPFSMIFSTDGKLILNRNSENSYRLWDRSSGSLLSDFTNANFPLHLQSLFKEDIITNSDFICCKTLSANEKSLFCLKMVAINPISLSEENFQVFKEKNAIVQKTLPKNVEHTGTD